MQEICEQNNLPAVYLIDSGGAFLPLQSEIFVEGGKSFYNEAIMNSKGIPQVRVLFEISQIDSELSLYFNLEHNSKSNCSPWTLFLELFYMSFFICIRQNFN